MKKLICENINEILVIIGISLAFGTCIGIIFHKFLKSYKIKTLKQTLADERLQNDVLVHSYRQEQEKLIIDKIKLETVVDLLKFESGNSAKVLIVQNKDPHHKADVEYVGIYPNNELIPPAHITWESYNEGVERLLKNPEDKIN